ncbi:MAG: HAD-IB family phosphatase [Candidatus Omnitrophica bacterium]|nr:HAD-IB family phosphatase [Candidatus Omnitrophota bacterium]
MKNILISDFDGTITQFDFYDLVCAKFPEISGGYWHQYEAGKLTHFEALRSIFAGIRCQESNLIKIIEQMKIEPKLKQCVSDLNQNGWELVVASAGCDWYIKRLLKLANVSIIVNANPGEFDPNKGLLMHLPQNSKFFSPELGINKVAVVRDALSRADKVAFAGDGRPDLAPALLVPPQRRFAKSWLAKKLTEIGEDFQPFENWREVAEKICS